MIHYCSQVLEWDEEGLVPLERCTETAAYFGDENNFCNKHAIERGLIPDPQIKFPFMPQRWQRWQA